MPVPCTYAAYSYIFASSCGRARYEYSSYSYGREVGTSIYRNSSYEYEVRRTYEYEGAGCIYTSYVPRSFNMGILVLVLVGCFVLILCAVCAIR